MFKTLMLTGLMSATLLSGIAPAYAQSNPDQRSSEQRGQRGGERAGRMDGGGGMMRGERMGQPRGERTGQPQGDASSQRWQQRPAERPTPPVAQARPDARPAPQWQGGQTRQDGPAQRDWRQDRQQQGRDDRPQNRDGRRDGQWGGRDDRANRQPNWQQAGQPNWQQGQRNDRQDWRNDRRDGRGNDGRWNENRGWMGNGAGGANWNNGGRFDDRTRWANQRRWDNGWRTDRRYDWNSYRTRYGDRYRVGRYAAPRGWDYGYRRFSVGLTLSSILYANNYWLDDPYSYRLPPAYGSLRWIRYYDDALLVDIRDGYVVDVINDFFW